MCIRDRDELNAVPRRWWPEGGQGLGEEPAPCKLSLHRLSSADYPQQQAAALAAASAAANGPWWEHAERKRDGGCRGESRPPQSRIGQAAAKVRHIRPATRLTHVTVECRQCSPPPVASLSACGPATHVRLATVHS